MSTTKSFVQRAIPRFYGHDYDHWCMLMENFLRSKQYWHLIENAIIPEAESINLTDAQKAKIEEEQKLKDLEVKNYLFQAIDPTILETIPSKDTSKQIWDSMKKKYQGTTEVKKRSQLKALRKDFETLLMQTAESVAGGKVNKEVVGAADSSKVVAHLLRTSDLETIIPAMHRKLEQKYGVDLSIRKKIIREQINLFLDAYYLEKEEETDLEVGEIRKEDPEEK